MEGFSYEQRYGADAVDFCFWKSDHRYWWYHRPRVFGNTSINPDHILEQTDSHIQPLLYLLLKEYGIPTLPSCAGHKISEEYTRKMWSSLKRDEKKINTVGLVLHDCETGEEERWYDRNFKVEISEADFRWKLFAREVGFVGFVLPTHSAKLLVRALSPKMPPLTSIQIWKEISPNVSAVGIENYSQHKKHTWKFICNLLKVFLSHSV